MIERRAFVAGGAAVFAMLRGAWAQPATKPVVIGLLDGGERLEWWASLKQQLRDLGYVEGRSLVFEERYAAGRTDHLPALAKELVQRRVRVIVTASSVATRAAAEATSTIPIVMAAGDITALGIGTNLARPSGNVTGVLSVSDELDAKRLEILREFLPKITRLAILWPADNPISVRRARNIEPVAESMKLALRRFPIHNTDELPQAFSMMSRAGAEAVFVIAGPQLYAGRRRIGALALKHQLPTIHTQADYVDSGGFVAYGTSYPRLFRRAAVYVDKILKGAKPEHLPVEQPTEVSLVINVKTAKALGLTIPPSLLLRADHVIE